MTRQHHFSCKILLLSGAELIKYFASKKMIECIVMIAPTALNYIIKLELPYGSLT